MCCAAGMPRVDATVVLWQSVDQRRREVEAADAASLSRLVRGVGVVAALPHNTPLLCFVLIMFVLLWSGGCGAWRFANSRGAQLNLEVAGLLASL